MRLLVLNYEYPPLGGGASPVSRGLCLELAARGHELDVVTMAYRGLPRLEDQGRLRIFRVPSIRRAAHICHAHEMLSYVASAWRTGASLLRSRDYDLIHAHFLYPSGVVAHLLHQMSGIPYVVTAHGSDVPGYNPDRFRTSHRLLRPLWRTVAGRASTIVCPSRWLADLVESHRPGTPVRVIPNGIDPRWTVPGEKQRTLLVVSRLFERKGIQFLLRGLRGIELDWTVHVVGDGPYRSTLEELARGVRATVVFHGWLDNESPELKRLYASAGLFVFPSLAENLPTCLLEAMLSGAAIVASDIPPCREALGHAARFVPAADPTMLASQLLDLVADDAARARLGAEARRRALDRFAWSRVGARYEEMFAAAAATRAVAEVMA